MLPVDYELLFGAFTNLFVIGWLAVFVSAFLAPDRRGRRVLLLAGGRVIPLGLLVVFVVGWALTRDLPGSITSYQGVLLSNSIPEKVLLAWFEILGLALLVCRWIVDDATNRACPRSIVAVGLAGAFIAAAIGLLVYLVLSRLWSHFAVRTTAG